MVVVFPAPLGPRKPWTSPVLTVRSRPSSARVGPNVFTRPDTAMAGVAVIVLHTLHSLHRVVKCQTCISYLPVHQQREDARVAEGDHTGRDDEAVRRFVERFALDLVEAGMTRMPARVFAAIIIADDGRLTAAELAERLHVSPAAISGAVRYLTQVRMLARDREPGERRDHYRVTTETWYEAIAQRDQLVARWEDDLAEGVKAVGPDSPAGIRLEETRQLLPRPRPVQPRGHLPDGVRPGREHPQGLGEPLLVVGDERVDAAGKVVEAPLVPGQGRRAGVRLQLLERGEVVAERVLGRLRVEGDVRADPGEHVVAGEQHPGALLVEAEVPGRVARRVHRHQLPAGHLRPVAVLQQHVRPGRDHEAAHQHAHALQLLDRGLGRAGGPQPRAGPLQQLVHVLVAVGDQRRVGRVERDPRARRLAHPPGPASSAACDSGAYHPGSTSTTPPETSKA